MLWTFGPLHSIFFILFSFANLLHTWILINNVNDFPFAKNLFQHELARFLWHENMHLILVKSPPFVILKYGNITNLAMNLIQNIYINGWFDHIMYIYYKMHSQLNKEIYHHYDWNGFICNTSFDCFAFAPW